MSTPGTVVAELSVIIPAHNSGNLIAETVARLAGRLAGRRVELIVVENGSTDDTLARCNRIASEWRERNVSFSVLRSEKGMGNALRTGILASRGEFVLLTADDLPFGFDDLDGAERIREATGAFYPVVIGSKAHRESRVARGPLRLGLTWGFGVMRRLILGMRTGDPQGTIFIDGELVRGLVPYVTEPGFLFTTELIYIVERLGIRPAEVPIKLSATHSGHPSRISVSDMLSMGVGLVGLRRRHRRDQYPKVTAGRTSAH